MEGNDEQLDNGYLAEPVARPAPPPVARAPRPKRTPSPGLNAAPVARPALHEPAIPKAPGTWAEMAKRPEYVAMSPEDRQLAREGYYDNFVAPNIPEAERMVSRELFLERSKTMDPKEQGFFGKVWDKLGVARHSIRQAAGTLPEQVEQARLEKKHGMGLMSKYVDRPDLMPKHVLAEIQASPEVKRTLMANWNAATPEQRLQLEQARGPMGEAARALNAKHPDALPKKKVPDYLGLGETKPVLTPDTSLRDKFDPRWEARQRNLISQGMDAKVAEGVARHDAYRDTTPGAPIAKIEKTDFDFETYKRYNKSPFFKNPLVRGAVRGANGYAQGIAGLNLFVAEAVGADDTAAGLARSSKNMHNFAESMGTPTDHIQRNFEGAVQSIGMQLPAMIGGAVTGSEGMVLGSMFLQTFGTEYADGRRRGQEQSDAIKRAALYGSFEVIGERFGLRKQLELMRQASRGVGTDVLAKWMAVTLKKAQWERSYNQTTFGIFFL
ncbi:MAG: hypothetical protein WKF61_01015, partial [Luteimonas sp.]